tara:strand:+ start:213 stop:317 length:105 start_codon:yes stop_codon:yes gene_type:complete
MLLPPLFGFTGALHRLLLSFPETLGAERRKAYVG